MAIDLHAHYLPSELVAQLRARHHIPRIASGPEGKEHLFMPIGSLAFHDGYVNLEARLQYMDKVGVKRQVLSLPGLFGVDSLAAAEALPLVQIFNDDLIDVCRRHPDRFSGLAALPLADPKAAQAELKRTRKAGLAGAILPVNSFLTEAHAERLRPLFTLGNELGAHFFIHPGRRPDQVDAPPPADTDYTVARRALAVQAAVGEAMATLLFSPFLDAFPNVTIHVANLGGTFPAVFERIVEVVRLRSTGAELPSARARPVYVDCSSLGPAALALAVEIFGNDRIVLGTDCPIFDTESSLAAIRNAKLSPEAQQAILHTNAKRLLRLAD